jgi:peptide deformylase
MKTLADLLMLGDPRLYEKCSPVTESERNLIGGWVADMHSVIQEIRTKYHFGRAIAAPQLGIMKRLIYMDIDRPVVIINPELSDLSVETFELWDDCMSFPQLLVWVRRHKSLTLRYIDEKWQPQTWHIEDSLAELIQHEYDHLDGILCTMRAIDPKMMKWRV